MPSDKHLALTIAIAVIKWAISKRIILKHFQSKMTTTAKQGLSLTSDDRAIVSLHPAVDSHMNTGNLSLAHILCMIMKT